MIKKWIRLAVEVFSCSIIIGGCGSVYDDSLVESENITTSIQTSDEKIDSINLELVTPLDRLFNTIYAQGKGGCYEIYSDEGAEWDMHILYTDFKTRQRVYLSNSVNEDHDVDGDTSFYSEPNSGYGICTLEDRLLVFKYGRDTYGDEVSESSPGCIYSSNLDGTNRTILTTFDQEYEIPYSNILSDGKYLYALSDSKTSSKTSIIRINLENGDVSLVKELGNGDFFILGCYEDQIILKEIVAPENVLSAEESYQKQTHVISTLSVENLMQKEVMSWQQNYVVESVFDEWVYYLDRDERTNLLAMNCKTGEKKVVADLSSLVSLNWDAFNTEVVVSKVVDDHIKIQIYSEDGIEQIAYAVDVTNGGTACVFKNAGGVSSYEQHSLYILNVWNDQLLVETDTLSIPREREAPDGSIDEGEYVMNNLAIVSKEDYWNGDYELIPIENTFLK